MIIRSTLIFILCSRIIAFHFNFKKSHISRLCIKSALDSAPIDEDQISAPIISSTSVSSAIIEPILPLTTLAKQESNSVVQHPLKLHIFVDGTWAYYSMIVGRHALCPIREKFGPQWVFTHRVDWMKLPRIIAANIHKQIKESTHIDRFVEVVRTSVFTSMREDTKAEGYRMRMVNDCYACNFDVHRMITSGHAEKCVDISLAVEMLFMATVPDAYDIAVILTGDKDFIPAMQKTRQKGKRVAICSMRNSCNRDLVRPDNSIRDYDVIWLDDYIDELIVPKNNELASYDDNILLELIMKAISNSPNNEMGSRQIGILLKSSMVGDKNALTVLKDRYSTLRAFIETYYVYFMLRPGEMDSEFFITLSKNELDEDEDTVGNANPNLLPMSNPSTGGGGSGTFNRGSYFRNNNPMNTRMRTPSYPSTFPSDNTMTGDGGEEDTNMLDDEDDNNEGVDDEVSLLGDDVENDEYDDSYMSSTTTDNNSNNSSPTQPIPLPPSPTMLTLDELNELKVADIKILLKDKELKVTGTKTELIERLMSHQDEEKKEWEENVKAIELKNSAINTNNSNGNSNTNNSGNSGSGSNNNVVIQFQRSAPPRPQYYPAHTNPNTYGSSSNSNSNSANNRQGSNNARAVSPWQSPLTYRYNNMTRSPGSSLRSQSPPPPRQYSNSGSSSSSSLNSGSPYTRRPLIPSEYSSTSNPLPLPPSYSSSSSTTTSTSPSSSVSMSQRKGDNDVTVYVEVNPEEMKFVLDLMRWYIQSSNWPAVSSREMGRFLARQPMEHYNTALGFIKAKFGSMFYFIKTQADIIKLSAPPPEMQSSMGEFMISLISTSSSSSSSSTTSSSAAAAAADELGDSL